MSDDQAANRGAFHHIDLSVRDVAASKQVYGPVLEFLGYPEYSGDYYAVFFADPDGIKLELVHAPGWI